MRKRMFWKELSEMSYAVQMGHSLFRASEMLLQAPMHII